MLIGPIPQFPPPRVGLAGCWARPVWGIHHGAPGVQQFLGAHSHFVVHMATRTMVANKQTLKGEDSGSRADERKPRKVRPGKNHRHKGFISGFELLFWTSTTPPHGQAVNVTGNLQFNVLPT